MSTWYSYLGYYYVLTLGLSNLNTNLVIYFTGYIFSNDTIDTLENYSSQLAKSVMKRAEAIYRNFDDTDVGQLIQLNFFPLFLFKILQFLVVDSEFGILFTDKY